MSESFLPRLQRLNSHHLLVCRVGVGKKVDGNLRAIMDGDKPLLYISDIAADGHLHNHAFDRCSRVSAVDFPFVEVVDCGDKCKMIKPEHCRVYRGEKMGITVACKPLSTGLEPIEDFSSYFFVHEDGIYPVVMEDDDALPLKDWVTVELKRDKEIEKTGILLNDNYECPQQYGKLTHIGPDVREDLPLGATVYILANQRVYQFGERWVSVLPLKNVLGVCE